MKIRKKLLALFLALVALLNMTAMVSADEPEDPVPYIQQMMTYYRYHGSAAATDIDCLLYQLSETHPYKAQDWASIMDYWEYVNNDMTLYPGVLPDGLPQNNTLCIVVMGYALKADGSMQKELIGRLETALASAKKYPNAYIACTGGGTASENKSRTEAGEMAKWLMEKGISEDRIIIENQSLSTVSNAINTCKILANDYPHVTHLAIVTSDYHLPRSCLLFHAQAVLTASKGAPRLYVAANAAYKTARSSENLEIQADNLSQLTGVPIYGIPKPKLSKLDRIEVSGETQCVTGTEPQLKDNAQYDSGLYRDVTRSAIYAGIDFAAVGPQELTVTYTEGRVTVAAVVPIEMIAPATEPPTLPAETESATAVPETEPPATEVFIGTVTEDAQPLLQWWFLPVGAAGILLIAFVTTAKRLAKAGKRRKAAKAAAKEEEIHLPDDDSPLEYI